MSYKSDLVIQSPYNKPSIHPSYQRVSISTNEKEDDDVHELCTSIIVMEVEEGRGG